MKRYLLLLLFLSIGKGYTQDIFENHAMRFYGSIGSGLPLFNAGVGASYVYEFGGKNSKTFSGVSVDTQLGVRGFSGLYFNIQSSFGVGRHYKDGGRFFFDIIGIGMGLAYESEIDSSFNGFIQATGVGALFNFLSFHHTTKTGFYFSWRNNLTILTSFTNKYIDNFGNSITVIGMGHAIDFRTYFTFGFDISKKYNPKIYEKRDF